MGYKFNLMNKDKVVLVFSINRSPYSLNFNIDFIVIDDLVPLSIKSGFYDLRKWIESRYILAYRVETEKFLATLGISNIEDFITVTKCVSLNDTFWVKPLDSGVSWKAVSSYRNPINKAISDYSFTSKLESKNIGSSPDFSTDGNFPKCWKREGNCFYLLKAGTSGAYNSGYEPYSEVFAYQLEKHLKLNAIEYKLTRHKGVVASKCKSLCSEEIGLISLRQYKSIVNTDFEWLVNNFNCRHIHEMLLLDYLLCNTDRHFGNIWFFVNNNSQKVIDFTPLGDNNLSCIPYYVDDEDLYYYIDDIRAKDGRTWLELLSLIDKNIAISMINKVSNFKFSSLGDKKADKRVAIVNKMLKYQINRAKKYLRV